MKTIAEIGKIKLVVREKDHNPPHAHLVGPGISLLVEFKTLNVKGRGTAKMKRLAQALVTKNLELCWMRWNELHGEE